MSSWHQTLDVGVMFHEITLKLSENIFINQILFSIF